jgi:RNA polymerase sigma-70 factor (ECF subfamily)
MADLDKIVRHCIAGKRKAQDQLYDLFSAMVYGVCLRYAVDRQDAEDHFQEVFAKVYQNLRKVQNVNALPGWVKSVAINTCVDRIRRDRVSWIAPQDSEEIDDQQYNQLLDRISEEQIIGLINELPDGYRIVFNLQVIDGYSHKEIAEQLKIAESTSRSQLTYAKRLLQQKLRNIGITRYESVI